MHKILHWLQCSRYTSLGGRITRRLTPLFYTCSATKTILYVWGPIQYAHENPPHENDGKNVQIFSLLFGNLYIELGPSSVCGHVEVDAARLNDLVRAHPRPRPPCFPICKMVFTETMLSM